MQLVVFQDRLSSSRILWKYFVCFSECPTKKELSKVGPTRQLLYHIAPTNVELSVSSDEMMANQQKKRASFLTLLLPYNSNFSLHLATDLKPLTSSVQECLLKLSYPDLIPHCESAFSSIGVIEEYSKK